MYCVSTPLIVTCASKPPKVIDERHFANTTLIVTDVRHFASKLLIVTCSGKPYITASIKRKMKRLVTPTYGNSMRKMKRSDSVL